jgi:hypothetical protein
MRSARAQREDQYEPGGPDHGPPGSLLPGSLLPGSLLPALRSTAPDASSAPARDRRGYTPVCAVSRPDFTAAENAL